MVTLAGFIALLVGGFTTVVVALLVIADRLAAADSRPERAQLSGRTYAEQDLTGAPAVVPPQRTR